MVAFACSRVSVVTGCWVLHKRPSAVLWLLRTCICEVHAQTALERFDKRTPSYAGTLPTNKNNDALWKCTRARLFVTVLLGADLPDDPLLPELALLVGDHDTIVS